MTNEINWEALDKEVDLEGLQADIEESKENGGGNFKEVPQGEYEVKLEKLELDKSKNGDPMVVCWFRILDGEFKNSMLFMYQVINQGFQIHIVNEFLKSLETDLDIRFTTYREYNELLLDVFEEMEDVEFALKYGQTKKGFNTFEVIEIF